MNAATSRRAPAGASLRSFGSRILAMALLASCSTETLFLSDFDETPVGQPPAVEQSVGTAHVDGPAGTVVVVESPALPSGRWLQIGRQSGPLVSGLQGKFDEFRGDGRYTFAATMFLPVDVQVATIQFETFSNPPTNRQAFLHLDLTSDNKVRIDDDDQTKFGSFPRGQPFLVQVTLDIGAAQSRAHVVLAGDGASGEREYVVPTPMHGASRQFGAIRIWQGFPHLGAFQATNIVVTKHEE